ncbi:hypothetical protein LMH87_003172 [Akanthomyces muscarius]|uniref:Uncharacterized protein n=1 Tax=Akanthomyces muscarius TaxID=2231603 RepID=A0A9W8UED7_AKAMU|nr:hypothetical protein LMH87_003172 [Akanthomyces muscarius]KAJ4144282.1 hypothetical protein LMH87_003172 [Akanthomyces muscarius]
MRMAGNKGYSEVVLFAQSAIPRGATNNNDSRLPPVAGRKGASSSSSSTRPALPTKNPGLSPAKPPTSSRANDWCTFFHFSLFLAISPRAATQDQQAIPYPY